MTERLVTGLLWLLDAIVSTHQLAKRRLRCAIHGHDWRPVLDAQLCTCGRWKD